MKPSMLQPRILLATFLVICQLLNEVHSIDFKFDNHSIYDYHQEIFEQEKALETLFLLIPETRTARTLFRVDNVISKPASSTSTTNSARCKSDLRNLASSLTQQWALPLIDSFGKPPSGILKGYFRFWTGNYDQCRSFKAPRSILFPLGLQGKYCIADIILNNATFARTGICVPNSCDSDQINDVLPEFVTYLRQVPIVKNVLKVLPEIQVSCLPESSPLNTASIAFIVLVSIIATFMVTGTGYDLYLRYKPSTNILPTSNLTLDSQKTPDEVASFKVDDKESEFKDTIHERKTWYGEFLMCFSVLKNSESLLDTSVRPGQLNCVHGIRFISMTWVILGHTYVFGITQISNFVDLFKQFNDWTFQPLTTSTFSVDTFFMLSGFLLTYLFLKDKNAFTLKKLGAFYSHRYIRLTPVYMMIVFAYASLYNFIGDGPYWPYQDQKSNVCTKYWWRNLLYINNLFPNEESCANWSWYLANDMQFYIISPLFLILIKSQKRKFRYLGLSIILLLLITSWIITIVIVFDKNIIGYPFVQTLTIGPIFDVIYYRPWARIGPYLIGCILGYVIVELNGKRNFMTWIWSLPFWMITFALGLVNVYGAYNSDMNLTTCAFYYGLSRSAWSLAVALVIFACLTGHGGPVDKFLSWNLFFPLGRLAYCAYLVHPLVQFYYYQNLRGSVTMTNTYIAIHYLGFTILSYGAAFITSLAFESPVIRLEKLLRQGVKS